MKKNGRRREKIGRLDLGQVYMSSQFPCPVGVFGSCRCTKSGPRRFKKRLGRSIERIHSRVVIGFREAIALRTSNTLDRRTGCAPTEEFMKRLTVREPLKAVSSYSID